MITATSQYTRLRPTTSANRPNTSTPRNAANSIVEVSSASLPEPRCHCLAISVEAIPITTRSEASVKNLGTS